MIVWREWWQRLRGALGSRAEHTDLDEELSAHLAMLTDEHAAQGMTPAEAARAARLALGGQQQIKEAYQDQHGIPFVESLWHDLRHAARSLRSNPGFSTVVLLTMALGIGVNTSVFSVLYSAWLAPMRYADPSSLVDASVKNLQNGWQTGGTTWANFADWSSANQAFTGLGAYRIQHLASLTGGGEPEEVSLARVSANLFPLLGVAPALGRGLAEMDDRAEGGRSAVLSHGYWRTHFDGNPGVLGRSISVDGEAFTIVGVMPEGFAFPPGWPVAYQPPLWLSLNLTPEQRTQRGSHSLGVVGRRRPGVSLGQAQAEMEAIVSRLAAAYPPENSGYGAWITPLSETRQAREVRPALALLMAGACLVLLIACANVANLLLVRGAARRREFAIRQALGVSGGRLLRQVLTESALLGLLGGAAGLIVAGVCLPLLQALLPRSMPHMAEVRLNPAVLAFSAACSLGCGLLFGLAPAFRASRVSIEQALRQSARTIAPRSRLARGLVVAEMGLALVLLTTGGLLTESFRRVSSVSFGFDREHVLTMRVTLPKQKYGSAAGILAFRRDLLAKAAQLPGITAVGTVDAIPLGTLSSGTDFDIEGRAAQPRLHCGLGKVSGDYLRAMGIPLRAGRYFTDGDRAGTERVAVVSESVSRRYWPQGGAVGRRIRLDETGRNDWFTVVGVVSDVRHLRADRPPEETIYALNDQMDEATQKNATSRLNVLVVRTANDPAGLAASLRLALREVDPGQPAADLMTMDQLVDRNIAGRKLNAFLLGSFSVLALVLAAIGLFGAVSAMVAGRSAEIGVRMALGAGPGSVAILVLREAGTLAVAGLLLGALGAAAAGRVLQGFLYDVHPGDPTVLAGVAGVLGLAMIAATVTPIRRALGVDPLSVLRED
ncbi:ABC transporter permease [Paludibaculum fermentans]|uniref:ABC transporter permease n=1 Tax=Paludibaculum fermentans TaxID=1473598 RepID=A0A7S7NX51_PALFE|nr:ABC transporter permease [Paludibaculum fermentans]QOY91426.1 ABC transporter permease [Paludibaculum fermentans]